MSDNQQRGVVWATMIILVAIDWTCVGAGVLLAILQISVQASCA